MTISQTMGARFGLAILGAGMLLAAVPAGAQYGLSESPSEALSRHLKSLGANPRSLDPLMGAGRAALELGDAQAALTFFGRAEEIAPNDGRIKMWIGSALVHLQQPQGALKFFHNAASLGVPEAELAAERGLAFDISGDPRQAQREYRTALQKGASPEVTRRLALSMAISGDKGGALRLIDDQLRRRDRDAERTHAFILALTGDTAGATRAVQASMPNGRGSAMAPFLQRLTSLSLADRALAVHLGVFPQSGRSVAPVPNVYASADPLRAGATDTSQAGLGRTPDPRRSATIQTAGRVAPRSTAPARPGQAASQRITWSSATRGMSQVQPEPPSRQVASVPVNMSRIGASAEVRGSIQTFSASPTASGSVDRQGTPASPAMQTQPSVTPQTAPPASGVQLAARAPIVPSSSAPTSQAPQLAAQGPMPQGSASGQAELSQTSRIAEGQAPVAFAPNPQIASAVPSSTPTQITPVIRLAPPQQQPSHSVATAPTPIAEQAPVQIARVELQPSSAPGFSLIAPATGATGSAALSSSDTGEGASASLAAVGAAPAPEPAPAPESPARTSRIADVAAAVAALPDQAPPPASAKAERPKAATPKEKAPAPGKTAAKPAAAAAEKTAGRNEASSKTPAGKKAAAEAAAKKPATPAEPARLWVQVAGGAEKASMPTEFARLKTKAPKLLAARTPWTASAKATNRLLVGPFKSEKEAQEFVNELAKSKLSAFAWTSEAGQKVEKLTAK